MINDCENVNYERHHVRFTLYITCMCESVWEDYFCGASVVKSCVTSTALCRGEEFFASSFAPHTRVSSSFAPHTRVSSSFAPHTRVSVSVISASYNNSSIPGFHLEKPPMNSTYCKSAIYDV